MRSSSKSRWTFFLILCCADVGAARAQESRNWKLDIGPRNSVRSRSFRVLAEETLRVTPDPDSRLALQVFVYDADTKELIDKSDTPAIEPFYRWRAQQAGEYYVVLRNTGEQSGSAKIRVVGAIHKEKGPGGGPGPAASLPLSNMAVVSVYYATDRALTGHTAEKAKYGTEPAENDRIHYGIANVSVPRAHHMGELEGPCIWKLEFRENPQKHVLMLSATPEQSGDFFRNVSGRVEQSAGREAFVFVHGFNVTFEDAVRRTAQISYDLGFDGAAILFSWPSHGKLGLVEYNKDGRNAELSVQHLRDFLSELALHTGIRTIHVIAHSMGNRVAVKALANMAGSPAGRPLHIREVALMAPDIDAAEFRKLAVAMKGSADRVTLYASSRDEALKVSERLAGYPRAGQGGDQIVVIPGVIETIDSSAVDTSLLGLGHSYFADNSTILSDLFRLIRGDPAGDRFGLRPMNGSQGQYWFFMPAAR